MRQAFLPASLAWYIAVSARAIRSSALSAWSGKTAMPSELVSRRLWPSYWKRTSAIARVMRSASTRSISADISGTRIANSSPPRRENSSLRRTCPATSPATRISIASPARWPKVSLMYLNSSRSKNSSATRVSWRWASAIMRASSSLKRWRL
ncbi:hypothetical protein D3C83_00380 [compost metagenome]